LPLRCNTLQHAATRFNTLQTIHAHCNTLQHAATHFMHTATHCNIRHAHCYTLQQTTKPCPWKVVVEHLGLNAQHAAIRCNTLQQTSRTLLHATTDNITLSLKSRCRAPWPQHCNTLQDTARHSNTLDAHCYLLHQTI